MNMEEKFQQFLEAIDEELNARLGITSEHLPAARLLHGIFIFDLLLPKL